ncbi:hypothetical protein CK203_063383 [Vitis vinifera]|uniref:Integrase zinc-binding domain-containing protein n=1 Tax=Vitis vinifera TaxID=29760 RepID=A0A438G678_VITVI|nr:hypothetical protein CK203_063383 [Vitis vinifera]
MRLRTHAWRDTWPNCLSPIKEAILLPIHVQANPSVAENSTCNTVEATKRIIKNGMHDIAEYLRTAIFHRALSSLSWAFKGQYVLAELHEGICGNHTGGRSLAHRAHSQGYYWPTMKKDAAAYVQKSMAFRAMGHGHYGTPPAAPAQKKFLLVATDYFSKWVEAEAYASIKDKDVTKFEFLFGIEYPEFILHATLSSKQWPGGSHKQNSNQCLKEKAGASQREVGGGTTRRPVGLSKPHPDDQQEILLLPSHMEWMQSFPLK